MVRAKNILYILHLTPQNEVNKMGGSLMLNFKLYADCLSNLQTLFTGAGITGENKRPIAFYNALSVTPMLFQLRTYMQVLTSYSDNQISYNRAGGEKLEIIRLVAI